MQCIPGDKYRTFGVYEDDHDEACLVVSIHKSVFTSTVKPGRAAAADGASSDEQENIQHDFDDTESHLSILDKAHESEDWIRFLLYTNDLVISESKAATETGQWCLLDEGSGHFLEASLSPNLQNIQVYLTRSVCAPINTARVCQPACLCYTECRHVSSTLVEPVKSTQHCEKPVSPAGSAFVTMTCCIVEQRRQ